MKFLGFICICIFTVSCISGKGREPSSNAKTVLYIGDSQSAGPLGGIVYNHLLKTYHEDNIHLFGVGGSSPRHWGSVDASERNGKYRRWLCSSKKRGRVGLQTRVQNTESICKGPKKDSVFAHLNEQAGKPDLVIFQFLGNSMKQSRARIINRIDNLLRQLDDDQKCLWITSPPYYRGANDKFAKRNRIRAVTEDSFVQAIGDRCEIFRGMKGANWDRFAKDYDYFYSKRSDGTTRGDGMHFNTKGARAFFESFEHKLP